MHPQEVSQGVVSDIDALLRQQHSKAKRLNAEKLISQSYKSKVVVAWNDGGRVIGIGVLVIVSALSHTFASIHNLVVLKSSDRLSIGKRIVDALVDGVTDIEFIEVGVLPEDHGARDILIASNFKTKRKIRYRLDYHPKHP